MFMNWYTPELPALPPREIKRKLCGGERLIVRRKVFASTGVELQIRTIREYFRLHPTKGWKKSSRQTDIAWLPRRQCHGLKTLEIIDGKRNG